jgi:hypothetical protein
MNKIGKLSDERKNVYNIVHITMMPLWWKGRGSYENIFEHLLKIYSDDKFNDGHLSFCRIIFDLMIPVEAE